MQFLARGFVDAVQLLWNLDSAVVSAAWQSVWISIAAVFCAGLFGIPTALALSECESFVSRVWVMVFRATMNLPTVLIGLLCYAMFSRLGPFGQLGLLYSPWGIVAGEFLLALPIIVSLANGAVRSLDKRVAETAVTLGAGLVRRWGTYISEARLGIVLAFLTSFSRCFTELGIAMMVGGNIKFHTRTLTTATALETSRGDFERGVAMSLILLAIGLLVTLLSAACHDRDTSGRSHA